MMPVFDAGEIASIRSRFPILSRTVHGKPLVYLDNAATSQMPESVIQAVSEFDRTRHANVHRGVHKLSQEATDVHEGSRDRLAKFLNARRREEIVLTKGATESINLVAHAWGRRNLRSGDVVLVSELEHHANIVPWQIVGSENGSIVVPIPALDDGSLDQDAFQKLLDGAKGPVKLLAVQHVSNALGTIHPVKEMVAAARSRGIATLVDGAQSVPHMPVDVQDLDCDFLAFSGHKMHGPTGTGVLYGRYEVLERLPPWMGGGDMIDKVSFSGTTFHEVPWRFEAGTPNFTGAAGFAAALDFLEEIGMDRIHAREAELVAFAHRELSGIPGLRILGTHPDKAGVVSFVMEGIHHYDAGMFLDQMGIAVRTGHHCAQPAMERYGVTGTIRASFAIFTTESEIEALAAGVRRVQKVLGG
ncbi:MAG TPA: SufS family cysteine desulfurase [Fibrobacteria bacterium]|nr:SufS family cysteine desulfurase [Fibrobacteria bacterium]